MPPLPKFRSTAALIVLAATLVLASSASSRSFHIDYSPAPDPGDLLAFDLSILSAETNVDLRPKQAAGGKALGYLSLVEVNPGTPAGLAAARAGVPSLGENTAWGTKLMDVTSLLWSQLVLESLAPALVAKGFDGFFLDTADSIAHLAAVDQKRTDQFAEALLGLIKGLRAKYPDKEIVINRGFALLGELEGVVDGVLIESVYRSFDAGSGEFRATSPIDSAALESKIAQLRAGGVEVYAVDYVAPTDTELADKTAERLAQLGAEPLVTTPALDGITLAPTRRELRKILVLYGWDETDRRPIWPIDTMTAGRLQMPLEWMGYECEYLHIIKQPLPGSIAGRYAGVIFDAALKFPYEKEQYFAQWAVRQKREGGKVLFAANLPFATEDALRKISSGFGLGGTCQVVDNVDGVEIIAIDEALMNFEAKVIPRCQSFLDLRAPAGASAKLTLHSTVGGRPAAVFEPVFTAPWGGVLLDPYVSFRASPNHALLLVDPFAFLGEIWPASKFPAPDPSTRQGLRVLASHIDGDGFANHSQSKRDTTCAEIIRERILKSFPIPITVSVIEANTRACEKILNPDKRESYEDLARSIFALPNVQAASHSYSHPYVWIRGDPDDEGLHESPRLALQDSENYHNLDYQREIVGSIDYIEKNLLPEGKKVELMLWSGNCRPPAEALRVVREHGIENMNGGDTAISRRNPSLTAVSPRAMPWSSPAGDELQIFSPNQNEFVYTQHWRGPYYGGYRSVIETFKMTESPRRLKPVNIYYHFYSAATLGSLRALEEVYRWAMAQPLHAITAAELAAMNRDSRATQLYRNGGSNDWTVVNEGRLRTLRIPPSLGLPSMAESEGVIGYREDSDQVYVHLDGRPKARLVLDTAPPSSPHLRLVSSSSNIDFESLTPLAAKFYTADLRAVSVVLGGTAPGSSWEITVAGCVTSTISDKVGRIVLDVPKGSTVDVCKTIAPHPAS